MENSKEKQIDEMAEMLNIIEKAREAYANDVTDRTENEYIREGLLDAGYVKQRVGEWIKHPCSYECTLCGEEFSVESYAEDYDPITDYDLHYCPNCGAKMKGE